MKIKATLRAALLLLYMAIGICCKGNMKNEPQAFDSSATIEAVPSVDAAEPEIPAGKTVYICVSKGAKRYHLSKACKGLVRCTHEISETTVGDAEGMGLSLCRWED